MCSNDAKSCYGRIVHAIASILMQHQNVPVSACIWAVASTPVLKMMKDEGFGFMYKTSIKGKELHFMGYGFIDETDIIQSGQPGGGAFQVLATHMKAAMDTWKGGLRATGGALEPEKSFWYLI
jgi:hypothetical protein